MPSGQALNENPNMNIDRLKLLRLSIRAGALYFFLVALAHALSIKLPGLFIYFDVPSQRYQDGIISFLVLGWAVFFFTASNEAPPHRPATRAILVAGLVAIAGLSLINVTTEFHLISPLSKPATFWLETALGALYWAWLIFLFRLTRYR